MIQYIAITDVINNFCTTQHSPHEFHVERFKLGRRLDRVLVDVRHMLGQTEVVLRVTLVSDEPQEVKAREQGSWQLDVGLC